MRTGFTSRRMRAWPEDVVRIGRLLHPIGVGLGQHAGAGNGLVDAPLLVGVDHQLVLPADLFAHQQRSPQVVCGFAANLKLEVGPAVRETFAAEPPHLLIAEAEPSRRGRVRGIAPVREPSQPLRHHDVAAGEDVHCLVRVIASSM